MKKCSTCQETKPLAEFHSTGYNRPKKDGTRTKVYKPDCKDCANAKWKQRFYDKLERAGVVWKCQECGYDRCVAAIEFHHLDPNEKDFVIAHAWTASFDRILAEISKCAILCANCHREVHAGVRILGC